MLMVQPDPAIGVAEVVGFRAELYGCLTGWGDALFELSDAMLCASGPVNSVPHLSLEGCFRRSHGSLYKALERGQIDVDELRVTLVAHRPEGWPEIFAVDASTWERCDAETSPGRGFYYHASRHSAGQPIVAGWSYQWISQLDWAADSWTAPLDARRIPPTVDTTDATVAQIRELVDLLGDTDQVPMFVFDAGYDPIALGYELCDMRAQVLVRIRDDRVFYTDPPPRREGSAGRPRRHGDRFALADPTTWHAPDDQLVVEHPRYGTVTVTARSGLHPRLGRRGHWTGHERPPIVARHRHPRRSRASAQAHRPRQEDPLAVVVGTRQARPRRLLPRLPTPLRPRTHLPVRQEHPGLDRPTGAHPRAGRPLDVAAHRRLHPAQARPRTRRRPPPALGTSPRALPAHPRTRPARFSWTSAHTGHPSQSTKIRRRRPRTPQRQPIAAQNPLPRDQEERLRFKRKLREPSGWRRTFGYERSSHALAVSRLSGPRGTLRMGSV
jgi:hypothetical protein